MIHTIDGAQMKEDWYYWSPHQHSCIFPASTLKRTLGMFDLVPISQRKAMQADEVVLIAEKV